MLSLSKLVQSKQNKKGPLGDSQRPFLISDYLLSVLYFVSGCIEPANTTGSARRVAIDDRLEDELAIGAAEDRFAASLGVGHHSQHIS